MDQTTAFECPSCGAQYKLVRVEAPASAHDPKIACLTCATPFKAREGAFVLKYFRVKRPKKQHRPQEAARA